MATTELDLEKLSKEAKEVFKLIKEKKTLLTQWWCWKWKNILISRNIESCN
ncbi:hypothetical protein [Vibrio cholerae]|uniref:hypothetical protein n=1 Tax=Vibrio cholerae TaxID=666 RepID=UPI00223A8CE4|nr:hypothetical protein [Vibrio cholerae]